MGGDELPSSRESKQTRASQQLDYAVTPPDTSLHAPSSGFESCQDEHAQPRGSSQRRQSYPLAHSQEQQQQQRRSHLRVEVVKVDMSPECRNACIALTLEAIRMFSLEQEVAQYVKRNLDRAWGPTWHVVVGYCFGSYVTHEDQHFIYLHVAPTSSDDASESLSNAMGAVALNSASSAGEFFPTTSDDALQLEEPLQMSILIFRAGQASI